MADVWLDNRAAFLPAGADLPVRRPRLRRLRQQLGLRVLDRRRPRPLRAESPPSPSCTGGTRSCAPGIRTARANVCPHRIVTGSRSATSAPTPIRPARSAGSSMSRRTARSTSPPRRRCGGRCTGGSRPARLDSRRASHRVRRVVQRGCRHRSLPAVPSFPRRCGAGAGAGWDATRRRRDPAARPRRAGTARGPRPVGPGHGRRIRDATAALRPAAEGRHRVHRSRHEPRPHTRAAHARGAAAGRQGRGPSAFMVLLAAFAGLLARHGGQRDMVIGVPTAGRGEPDLEPVVGCFADIVPFPIRLAGLDTFADLLSHVRDVTLDTHDRPEVPLARLVAALRPVREQGRKPLVQVVFQLNNAPAQGLWPSGLTVTGECLPPTSSDGRPDPHGHRRPRRSGRAVAVPDRTVRRRHDRGPSA